MFSSLWLRIFQRVLILGAADAIVHSEILHRLHVEHDSRNLRQFRAQAIDHLSGGNPALLQRFQIDLDSPAVQRRIGSIRSDEGRDTLYGGVGQQDLHQILLFLSHGFKGSGGGCLRDALNDASILGGKEAFGNDYVEDHRQHQNSHRDQKREGLIPKHKPSACGRKTQ